VGCIDEPDSLRGFSSEDMDSEATLASKGGFRAQPEVTQGEVPSGQPTNHGKEWFSAPLLPTTTQPSATVNPLGSPAWLRNGAPNRTVHGPGLNWDMLTSPRCSKSHLHRQRIRARLSHSLYPPLTGPIAGPDAVRSSRGYHQLPSCSPTPISTRRTVRPNLLCPGGNASVGSAALSPRTGEVRLTARHHAGPKELPLADHIDAAPHGTTLVTPKPPRVSARGQARTGEHYTSYVRDSNWSSISHHSATVTSRHAAGRAEVMPPPPHRRLTSSTEDVIC
jgi:hypothetical protein